MSKIYAFEIIYRIVKHGRLYHFMHNSATRCALMLYNDTNHIGKVLLIMYLALLFVPHYVISVIDGLIKHKIIMKYSHEVIELLKGSKIFREYENKIEKIKVRR